jgi:hypothetical protein
MFGSRQGASNPSWIELQSDNTIRIVLGVNSTVLTTTRVFRDPSAWYHLVLSVTASGASYFYVNGIQVGTWTSSATPYLFNSSYTNAIGRYGDSAVSYFDGYMAEVNFVDGQALTPSSFGETDVITGRWKAKAYGGTYGTTGFYLSFKDNTSTTTLGYDDAGSNDWTLNNFSVTAGAGNDSLVDSPTNYGADTGVGGNVRGNYCTVNPLKNFGITLTNGNLDGASNTSTRAAIYGTIGASSGKWYWEVTQNSVTGVNAFAIGIANAGGTITDYPGVTANEWTYYGQSGQKVNNNTLTAYGASFTTGDIIGVALDIDAGTLVFYKNNVSQGTAFTGLTSGPYFPAFGDGGTTNAQSWSANFGQRPFAYTAPSGFKALCTQNLPQPTIQKPSKYMDALAYTGTGASNSISSLGFSPDLVWIKNRGTTTDHALYDILRGAQAQISSNTTGSEVTSSSGLTAFGSAGFTIGTSSLVNTSGTQYVAWSWDAGSTNSTNTSGSITSTIRTNPQAGFSIVSYTGNGTAGATIGHGLGSSPKMLVVKSRSRAGDNWDVYHASIGATGRLYLNLTNATDTSIAPWNNTAPTSSVFSVGTAGDTNANTVTYIAYCFAEIEGYSKFGSYTGNGSADGPFVWCGFRPRWILFKASSVGGAGYNWGIYDSARDTFNAFSGGLFPNLSDAEVTSAFGDMLSNGFKLRNSSAAWNSSGQTYIFAAFAESPFKYARAR